MEEGESWGDVRGLFALQPQRLMYGAAENAAFPERGSPFWGAGIPPWASLRRLVRRRRDLRHRGQPAAAGTERSRFAPGPSSPSVRLGVPFPANPGTSGITAGVSPTRAQHRLLTAIPSSPPVFAFIRPRT